MTREVLLYGTPILRQKARPIARITDAIRQLAADMLETMYASRGLGLAAEQVGESWALCVIDVPPAMDVPEEGGPRLNPDVTMPLTLLNPAIVEESAEKELRSEGCLSFTDIQVPIRRAFSVTVRFLTPNGDQRDLRVHGLLARAVQHELDHLSGILLVDRMSPVKKISLAGQLKKLKKEAQSKASGAPR
jgi:peptide deformylase